MQTRLCSPQDVLASLSPALPRPVHGNDASLLVNGALFDAMLESISAARSSVHLENYLWKRGRLSERVVAALCDRARAGCAVRVVVDAVGARGMDRNSVRRMRDCGCEVALFRKIRWRNLGRLNSRDHRKIVVVDGTQAFVGGHCITDHWLGDAQDERHYGDLSIRLRGPAVHQVQAAFAHDWRMARGQRLSGAMLFPPLAPAGQASVLTDLSESSGPAKAIRAFHQAAIAGARRRVWIQNPYFIPGPALVAELACAAGRGVDVRVLMPSASATDNPIAQHASHASFARLLEAGVRLFEYPHTLLHQKVMTVDGQWSAVGSSNFDARSFDINLEVTLGIQDPALARDIDAVFERYAGQANEIEAARWRERGLLHRLVDRSCHWLRGVL